MTKPRCQYCGRWFKPKPGIGSRQVTCLSPECTAAHKKYLDRQWHEANPERTLGRQGKIQEWSAHRGGYHRSWRAKHAAYVERNREATRERMRRLRQEQKQVRVIRADPVGYLRGLRTYVCKTRISGHPASPGNEHMADDVCKTRTGGAVLVGVVDYLLTRAMFAKHEEADRRPGSAV